MQIAQSLHNHYRIAKAQVRLSALHLSTGGDAALRQAARLATAASRLGKEKKLHHFEIIGRSYAAIALSRLGRQRAAVAVSRQAVRMLAAHEHFDGSRAEILFHQFSVLEICAPDEAQRAAQAAYDALVTTAERIQDAALRSRFLSGIALHRSICETMERIGAATIDGGGAPGVGNHPRSNL